MTKATDINAIEEATGISWKEWMAYFKEIGADKLSHKEIAEKVYATLSSPSAGWWAQGITVAYEQQSGRRLPGQRSDGTFEVSITKTIAGNKDDVYAKVQEIMQLLSRLNGHKLSDVRTSITPVRSYWRCSLDDESKVEIAIEQRDPSKVLIAAVHTNFAKAEEAEKARTFWKQFLSESFESKVT